MATTRFLTALPVYNEVKHVAAVLAEVRRFSPEILVVDDGSSDGSGPLLDTIDGIHLVHHPQNRGYGAALLTAFDYAVQHRYDVLVTIDCDGQHQPCRIPQFVEACQDVDIVSGSRYLQQFAGDSRPPEARRKINEQITAEINQRLGLHLTDAFCGFKAYRVEVLPKLKTIDTGYAMPLELWVRASHAGLRIVELPVPLIYLPEERSFGGSLDDAQTRLNYYRVVIDRSLAAVSSAAAPTADSEPARGTLCGECAR
ncbi:MAG TPA: glycosyltransferase family 2 protein [Pirellulales bacterium]|nr:glycosyltransferase family 2 protein [Pirellulales bacterium]